MGWNDPLAILSQAQWRTLGISVLERQQPRGGELEGSLGSAEFEDSIGLTVRLFYKISQEAALAPSFV